MSVTPSRVRRLASQLVTLFALMAVFVSACGVPLDPEPRVIAASELNPSLLELPTTVAEPETDEAPGLSVIIFLANSQGRLEPVSRKAESTPAAALEVLLQGPTAAERERGLTTALSDVELLEVTVSPVDAGSADDTGSVSVTLSEESLNLSVKNEQLIAFGQMVYTLTALTDVNFVRFIKEGNQGRIPTDDGSITLGTPVDKSSFESLSPRGAPAIDFADETGVGPSSVSFYFVDPDNKLKGVTRNVDVTPQRLLADLFAGPSVDETRIGGLRTRITGEARALSITIGSDEDVTIALIDLSAGSIPSEDEPESRGLALAQLVYTITELPTVEQVVIQIDGVTQGQGQRLTRDSFRDLLAPAP